MKLHNFLLTGIGLGGDCTAARSGGGMEINRMDERAIGRVLQMHFHRVADPHPNERTGHLAIEGPVPERGALSEPALEFDREKVHANELRGCCCVW